MYLPSLWNSFLSNPGHPQAVGETEFPPEAEPPSTCSPRAVSAAPVPALEPVGSQDILCCCSTPATHSGEAVSSRQGLSSLWGWVGIWWVLHGLFSLCPESWGHGGAGATLEEGDRSFPALGLWRGREGCSTRRRRLTSM